jgi:hypothetical protein
MEEDDAGKLAAFRAKFGRGWDAEGTTGEEQETIEESKDTGKKGDVSGSRCFTLQLLTRLSLLGGEDVD